MISIDTITLKEILSKMSKCMGNDKNVPITQLLHIKSKDNKIVFLTTDEINALEYTYEPEPNCTIDDIDITVMAEQFIKLASKFSSKDTKIGVSDSGHELTIIGNGEYKLSLPLNSEGNPIVFPKLPMIKKVEDVEPNTDNVYYGDISLFINSAKFAEGAILKPSIDLQIEDYPRTNYYFGSIGCVTLDGFRATLVETNEFKYEALIYPSTIKLLSLLNNDNFESYKIDDILVFKCDGMILYAKCADGLDAYPYEVATSLLNQDLPNSVSVAASGFLSALDRLKLFITSFDDNCITLDFNENGLFAKTMSGAGVEQIAADKFDNTFTCTIDIDTLISQLKCLGDSVIKLWFGDNDIIQMMCENVKQLVVLCNNEDE